VRAPSCRFLRAKLPLPARRLAASYAPTDGAVRAGLRRPAHRPAARRSAPRSPSCPAYTTPSAPWVHPQTSFYPAMKRRRRSGPLGLPVRLVSPSGPLGLPAPTRVQRRLHAGPEAPGRVARAQGDGGPVWRVSESANVNAFSRGYRVTVRLTTAVSVVSVPIPDTEITLAVPADSRHRLDPAEDGRASHADATPGRASHA